ncbi:MAG: hypothetical protein ACRESS_12340 [Stenotrophobium sp.]
MQIKIEIDVKPEELRRFLGLPDISGLQEEIIAFLRDKVGAASEFDAAGFVKSNIETLRNSSAWKNIVSKVGLMDSGVDDTPPARRKSRTRKPASE